jgi:hypothetical protein
LHKNLDNFILAFAKILIFGNNNFYSNIVDFIYIYNKSYYTDIFNKLFDLVKDENNAKVTERIFFNNSLNLKFLYKMR